MFDRIFSSRDYVTLSFPKGEEILVQRSIIERSKTLQKLLKSSHTNILEIDKVAHETFDDVVRLLNHEDPIHMDDKSVQELMKAIKYLEINDLESKMTKILMRTFQDPKSS